MKIVSYFMCALTIVLLLTGCAAKDPLTAEEVKILDAVIDVLDKNEIVILPELCSARTIIAAKQMFKSFEGKEEEHQHDHNAGEEEGGHHYILIVKATPGASGKYLQPVLKMGSDDYFYKQLYTLQLEGKVIGMNKSTATEGDSSRSDAVVEQQLLQKIAQEVNGKVQGSSILLP